MQSVTSKFCHSFSPLSLLIVCILGSDFAVCPGLVMQSEAETVKSWELFGIFVISVELHIGMCLHRS